MLKLVTATVVAAALGAATQAAADVGAKVGDAEVAWSDGALVAPGVAPADRRAPSPAVARTGARIRAEDAARGRLRAAALALPWAAGGSVEQAVKGHEGALDRAVARAQVIDADFDTDGSARVTMSLPIEAVRVAIAGARRVTLPAATTPAAVSAIVIDARALGAKPTVGLAIEADGVRWTGPVLWVDAPPVAGDPRSGAAPLAVKAKRLKAGVLALRDAADLGAAAGAVAVVIIGGGS